MILSSWSMSIHSFSRSFLCNNYICDFMVRGDWCIFLLITFMTKKLFSENYFPTFQYLNEKKKLIDLWRYCLWTENNQFRREEIFFFLTKREKLFLKHKINENVFFFFLKMLIKIFFIIPKFSIKQTSFFFFGRNKHTILQAILTQFSTNFKLCLHLFYCNL